MTDDGNDRDQLINAAIKASIKFEELMDKTDFDSWLDGVCLCSWDEIPKNDNELLKKFLKDKILIENFGIEGVETAKIEKIKEGSKTIRKIIRVYTKENSLSLRFNDDKTRVEPEIDNGRVYEFTVETNGDKLNICFTDSSKTLEYLGQSDGPFKNYETKRDELKGICDRMTPKGEDKYPKVGDKSSLERYLRYKLFDAKIKRLEARICSSKEDEEKEYNKVLHTLLSALNALHNLEGDNKDTRWFVLLYNDLSICYAGLDNSSMSWGYAEEASRIIKKEDSYKLFDKNLFSFSEIPTDKKQQKELLKYLQTIGYGHLSKSLKDVKYILKGNNLIAVTKNGTRIAILEIKNDLCYFKWGDESDIKLGLVKKEDDKLNIYSDHDFVSSKLFELYTISLFNQAEAERRSYRYAEAEKNFKKIIKYGNENIHLINFNYYSAILYLSLLYIDQGRGKEAIELLEKVINKSCLFGWDNVPGADSESLLKFFMDDLDIGWAGNAEISKSYDGKTIYISKDKNSAEIIINKEKEKAILKISDGKTHDLKVKKVDGKLNIYNNSNEADIRYWKAFIAKSQALIDQSEYDEAKGLLFNKFLEKQKNSYVLNEEHRVTSQGFKGLNYFTSCQIEKVRNTLKIKDSDKAGQLNKVKKLMEENISNFKKRKQKGFETKAYKHLSEIYTLLKKDTTAMKYFIKYLSNGDMDKLKNFVSDPKMEDWIDECNDLDFLERFIEEICKLLKRNGRYLNKEDSPKILKKLEEKIKRECEDKDQLSRAARIVKKIKEVLGEGKSIEYEKDTIDNLFGDKKKGLTAEDIINRLDINEKGFDSAFFKRSEMNKPEHIAEVLVLRRWNSFSPGLYRESIGSLGGGYLLRIKKNSYLFSFSDIAKEKEMQELLNRLRALDHSDLAEIMGGAEYSKKGRKIQITKNNERIATVKIEGGFCYLERQGLKLKLGVVEEKDTRLFSVSTKIEKDVKNKVLLNKVRDVFKDNNETLSKGATIHKVGDGWEIADERKTYTDTYTVRIEDEKLNIYEKDKLNIYSEDSDVENIVIDPGYNFLQNFRSEGFHVEDIDTIIVTHSHLDHCAELLPIMDLIFQFNKRYESTPNGERQKKRVNLCLSQGTYKKFSSYTNDPDWQKQLKDVIILEDLPEKKWIPFKGKGLTISAIQTPHWDLGGVNAIGLMIEIDGVEGENEENSKTVRLGFTGDTPWYRKIREHFGGCDILCVHLGSIKYQEIGYRDDRYNIKGYLFSWDKIWNDNERLIKFLKEDCEIKWVKTAKIDKIEGDKTLRVYTKENSLSLRLNDEKTNVNLEIDGVMVNEFTAKTENGKLNIYLTRKISSKREQRNEFNKTYATANHLFFFGTLDVIESCANKVKPLIIVGEFGEELKYGLRTDLCKKLSKKTTFECFPSDIELYIGIEEDGTKKVRCNFCEDFVGQKEIRTCSYGREDALHYICQTCNNTLSKLQKQAIIEHRVTRH